MAVPRDEFQQGDRLAGFRILERLGRGGMGSVYLAEDEHLRRRVALKVIITELAQQEGFRRRFEAEARGAAAIEHLNIVPVLSAGADQGRLYLAMRYVEGQNLNQALEDRAPLEADEATRIASDVAGALDAAHAAGLVHRDVTPANILLEGELGAAGVYLTDFGLVRGIDTDETRLTRTDQVIANLDYAAPEQITSGRVDARTDVYGLGCVLYRMRSGARPFPGNDTQKMWKIVNEPVPPITDGGDPLDEVIARATAKDPEERYKSAGDLALAAAELAAGRSLPTEERSVATGLAASGYSEAGDHADATRPLRNEVFVTREDRATQVMPGAVDGVKPRRGRVPAAVLAGAAILAGAIVAVAIATGGSGSTETVVKQTTVTTTTEAETAKAPSQATTKPAGAVSRAEPQLREIQGRIYTAKVPLEWQQDFELEEKPPYYPMQFSAPEEAGEPYVRLEGQYPAKVYDPVEAEEGPRQTTSESPDYREISFGPKVIGGREAVVWDYEVEGDRRVVYGFVECGGGLAIVGSASPDHFAEFAPVFEEVAASMHILCQD